MLISKIISFIFVVVQHHDAEHGLKRQRVLVPTGLEKTQKILPRSSNEEYLISLGLNV